MRWHYSWSYEFRGPAAIWVGSFVFLAIGILIAVFLPPLVLQQPDEGTDPVAVTLLLRMLGGVFILIGGVPFALMLGSLWCRWKSPQNVRVWHCRHSGACRVQQPGVPQLRPQRDGKPQEPSGIPVREMWPRRPCGRSLSVRRAVGSPGMTVYSRSRR